MCAFMLSMVNANLVSSVVTPYVWAVAFMFGGFTQLIAGLIQLRTGNTWPARYLRLNGRTPARRLNVPTPGACAGNPARKPETGNRNPGRPE